MDILGVSTYNSRSYHSDTLPIITAGEETRNNPGETLVQERFETNHSQAIARRQSVCDRSTKCIRILLDICNSIFFVAIREKVLVI